MTLLVIGWILIFNIATALFFVFSMKLTLALPTKLTRQEFVLVIGLVLSALLLGTKHRLIDYSLEFLCLWLGFSWLYPQWQRSLIAFWASLLPLFFNFSFYMEQKLLGSLFPFHFSPQSLTSYYLLLITVVLLGLIMLNYYLLRQIPRSFFVTVNASFGSHWYSYLLTGLNLGLLVILSRYTQSWSMDLQMDYERRLMVLFLILLGVFSLILSLMQRYHQNQRAQSQEQWQHLESYLTEVEQTSSELSQFRHDYTNLMHSFQLAIHQGDIDRVQQIYDQVVVPTQSFLSQDRFQLVRLNRVLDLPLKSLIAAKVQQATEESVTVILDIPDEIQLFPDVDYSIILRVVGVLLDNAIEHVAQLDDGQVTVAYLQMGEAIGMIVENTYQGEITTLESLFKSNYSTKQAPDGHGVGLAFVGEVVRDSEEFALTTKIEQGKFCQEFFIFDRSSDD